MPLSANFIKYARMGVSVGVGIVAVGALGIATYAAINSNAARTEINNVQQAVDQTNQRVTDVETAATDQMNLVRSEVDTVNQRVTTANDAIGDNSRRDVDSYNTLQEFFNGVDTKANNVNNLLSELENKVNGIIAPLASPTPTPTPRNVLRDCNDSPLSMTDTALFAKNGINLVCIPAEISATATPAPSVTPTAIKISTATVTSTATATPTGTVSPTPVKAATPADSVTVQAAKQYLDSFNSLPDNVVRRVLFYSVGDCNKVTFATGTVGADRKINYTNAQHFQVKSRSQLEEIANAVGAKIPSGESKRDVKYSCVDSRGVTNYLVGLTAHKPSNVDQLGSLVDAVKREALANLLGMSSVKVNPPLNYH